MQKDPSIDVVVVDRKSTRKRRRRRRRRTKKKDNDIFPLLSSSWRRRRPLKRDQHHRRERSTSRIARGRDAFFFLLFFFFFFLKSEERRRARKTFHATFSRFLPPTPPELLRLFLRVRRWPGAQKRSIQIPHSKKFPVQNRALPPLLLRDIKNTRKKSSQHQNARFERGGEEEEEEEERGKEGKQGEGSPSFFFLKTHSALSSLAFSTTVNRTTVEMNGKVLLLLFYSK